MRARLICVAILSACIGGKGPATPAHGLDRAALPFHVLDRTGHQLDEKSFWDQLAAQRAVCVGEEHNNPHHHWVQLDVVRHLAPRWPLLALNAAKELTKKVVHHGLDSLTPDEKTQVPQLDLDDKAHRAWFDALMEDMGGSEAHSHAPAPTDPKPSPQHGDEGSDAEPQMPSADRIYTVQVIWDETLADTAATWLQAHPDGHLVLLSGDRRATSDYVEGGGAAGYVGYRVQVAVRDHEWRTVAFVRARDVAIAWHGDELELTGSFDDWDRTQNERTLHAADADGVAVRMR